MIDFANQSDFAALHNVSRKTVTTWKAAGFLVLRDGKVDVRASDARLRERRLGRFAEAVTQGVTQGRKGNKHAAPDAPPALDLERAIEDADAFIRQVLAGQYSTFAEAERIKENALALKHVLEARQKAGALVEVEVAESILFESARSERDAWMNWPARVGPLIAAAFGIDADRVTTALTEHVHQQLADLGEPEADFVEGSNA